MGVANNYVLSNSRAMETASSSCSTVTDPTAVLKHLYQLEEFKVPTSRTAQVLQNVKKLLGGDFSSELERLHALLDTKVSI